MKEIGTPESFVDHRWRRLADTLVRYSTAVRPGDRVLISMHEIDTFPLVRALNARVVAAGGYPHVEFQSTLLERDLLTYGTDEQIGTVPELSRAGMEWADVYIGIRGSANPHAFHDVAAERLSRHRKALGTLSAYRTNNTRWVLSRIPGDAMAQQAGISTDRMMQLFFDSVLGDWEEAAHEFSRIESLFTGASRIRIVGPGTDLVLDTGGRRFVLEDGHVNMPGGELFTSPVETSAEGVITFTFPGVFAGRAVDGIRLRFSRGEVVAAEARSNKELLTHLLHMDDGAKRIGELGIGLNTVLDRCFRDPLYDEKIRGTVHIALGRSYSVCGGKNGSALHWDLVTDLREEGEIYVDGHRIFRDGAYVTPSGSHETNDL